MSEQKVPMFATALDNSRRYFYFRSTGRDGQPEVEVRVAVDADVAAIQRAAAIVETFRQAQCLFMEHELERIRRASEAHR